MSVHVQNKDLRSITQDLNFNNPHINLTEEDKKIIRCESNDGWLEDSHMSAFSYLLNKAANYEIRPTYLRYNLLEIKPVRKDRDHIQILHRPQHWTCSYYDGTNIYIYDTLQNFADPLHKEQKLFLEKLYPHITITKKTVRFPIVQQQKNTRDCGVMAIAIGISLAFSIKPQNVYYNTTLMRNHLLKLLTEEIQFEHFPQDLNVTIPQQVLPLQVARQKCYERLRMNIQNRGIKVDVRQLSHGNIGTNIFMEHNYSSWSNITNNNNNMNKAIINVTTPEKSEKYKSEINDNAELYTLKRYKPFLKDGNIINKQTKLQGEKSNFKIYLTDVDGNEFMNDIIVNNLRRSCKHSISRANKSITIPRSKKLRKIDLSEKDEKIIQIGEWLEDTHINHFHNILRQFHGYEPIVTLLLQCPDVIIPVDKSKEHIQILYSQANDDWSDNTGGHWVCCYYD